MPPDSSGFTYGDMKTTGEFVDSENIYGALKRREMDDRFQASYRAFKERVEEPARIIKKKANFTKKRASAEQISMDWKKTLSQWDKIQPDLVDIQNRQQALLQEEKDNIALVGKLKFETDVLLDQMEKGPEKDKLAKEFETMKDEVDEIYEI